MLELNAIQESDSTLFTNCTPYGTHNCAIVSVKIWKVLTGSHQVDRRPLSVLVQNAETSSKVICSLYIPAQSCGDSGSKYPPASIILTPPCFASLAFEDEHRRKVTLTVLKNDIQQASVVTFTQVQVGLRFSDVVFSLAIERFLAVSSRVVCCGEYLAVPVWNSFCLEDVTQTPNSDYHPQNWIGPGRVIDTTRQFMLLQVLHLESTSSSTLKIGVIDSKSKVLLSRVATKRCAIPGIKRFLFRTESCQSRLEIESWIRSNSRTALIVGQSNLCDFETALDASRIPVYTINCQVHQETLIEEMRSYFDKSIQLVMMLSDFDFTGRIDVDMMSFLKESLINFPKLRIMVGVRTYESVGEEHSLFFDTFIDFSIDSIEHVCEAYRHNVVHSSVCDARVEELRARGYLGALSESRVCVLWDQIGGLDEAKRELRELLQSKLRRGILLFGPPGTGKTMLAKAVATELGSGNATFISVKGPEILSMYIGESEKNIREIFTRAKSAKNSVVVFFDELDSIAPSRGGSRDSGNVMDRVVASLITEIDNLPDSIVLIGATNRPDLLDPSLLRPGRIDRQVYVGIPEDKTSIVKAVAESTYGLNWPDEEIQRFASLFPPPMTGSDVAAVFKKAYTISVKNITDRARRISKVTGVSLRELRDMMEREPMACNHEQVLEYEEEVSKCLDCGMILLRGGLKEQLFKVAVNEDVIKEALKLVSPSVTESDLMSYNLLRDRRATVIG
jgi:DNA polymerase III delta prime subunit